MRKITALICSLALALMLPATALADHIEGSKDWYVEYNEAGRVVDNYSVNEFADDVSQLQPGDDIMFTVEVRQTNETPADWYISNEVLKSLEEGAAKGSAYGYTLAYEGPDGKQTLYDSESVGGKDSKGLFDATNAMDDYFYLGTLAKGETGKVTLNVVLDGETEGNDYFDTLAQLALKFAVEPQVNPTDTVVEETVDEGSQPSAQTNVRRVTRTISGGSGPTTVRTVSGSKANLAKTGDETSMLPVYLAIAGVGIVCLALAIRNLRNKNKGEEDEK
ncbi:MAG: hypothetical protein IKG21_11870 [Atopobiaceae bacterium]|nr:hypothetical protein [Atopobiaceae bacterium]